MPVTEVLPRHPSSESVQDAVLDILVITSISVLCVLIVGAGIFHCIARRSDRERSHNDWLSRRLNIINSSSSSSPSSTFPREGDYLVYEVELASSHSTVGTAGDDRALQGCEKDHPKEEAHQPTVESNSATVHLLVPISTQPTFLPRKM